MKRINLHLGEGKKKKGEIGWLMDRGAELAEQER